MYHLSVAIGKENTFESSVYIAIGKENSFESFSVRCEDMSLEFSSDTTEKSTSLGDAPNL